MLHVSATLSVILREVHYKEYITKLLEPMHKSKTLRFKMYGLMYILKYKIQYTGWLGDLSASILLYLDDETLRNSYIEFIIKILSAF
jgi:hypothetical protein